MTTPSTCPPGECLASGRVPCPICGRIFRLLPGEGWKLITPGPEWECKSGGVVRPDAPRYPATPGAYRGGRDRKAPKESASRVSARLSPQAAKALEKLMDTSGRGKSDVMEAALIALAALTGDAHE